MEADWKKETPLDIKDNLLIEDKMKCPRCGSDAVGIITTKEIKCLNCGSHKKRFKCERCNKVFGEVPL